MFDLFGVSLAASEEDFGPVAYFVPSRGAEHRQCFREAQEIRVVR